MLLPLWREHLRQEEFHKDTQERAKSKTGITKLNRKEVPLYAKEIDFKIQAILTTM